MRNNNASPKFIKYLKYVLILELFLSIPHIHAITFWSLPLDLVLFLVVSSYETKELLFPLLIVVLALDLTIAALREVWDVLLVCLPKLGH